MEQRLGTLPVNCYWYVVTIDIAVFQFLAVAYRGGGVVGGFKPPEIPKALQNRAKLNPIVKTIKNC